MSYVRFNDQHDDGQLTQFRERLSAEVRVQTGEEFPIFQDRNDISWGQAWQQRIDDALDTVTLLLVIVTPSFFRSPACRKEVERFIDREHKLGRQDLILPVYYVDSPVFNDPALRDADEIAQVLASRQFADWRELRFEPFTSPAVRKTLAQLATRMRDTFWRPVPEDLSRLSESTQMVDFKPSVADSVVPSKVVAKTEPPTHIVDPYERGDFSTIAEAVKAAKPGDRILVRPGLYNEALVIDKPLEILGQGPVQDIELKVLGEDAIIFQANIGRIANLTIRQLGGGDELYAVDIVQGRLDLEGCDISSASWACVVIRDGADPHLRGNRIHDGAREGVFIYDEGRGILEDNEIFNNADDGISVMDAGNPTLRRNQIHENRTYGVQVLSSGLGVYEDNDIAANVLNGVLIRDGGNPTMRRNRVHDNKASGVYVFDNSHGTFEGNDISDNAYGGMLIRRGSDAAVRDNSIHDNRHSGVQVLENSKALLENNDIVDNGYYGLSVSKQADPTVRGNRINRNRRGGIRISADAVGVYENNDLTGNHGKASTIAEGAAKNITFKNNKE